MRDELNAQLAVAREGIKDAFSAISSKVADFALPVGAVAAGLGFLASRAMEAGTAIQDLSYKAGVSVEFASNLSSAAKVLGVDMNVLGNMIFQMNVQMERSPKQFNEGLHNVGLSLKEVINLDPETRFRLISDAFRENATEANRSATAVELFGRSGRDAIPLLMQPLGDLIKRSQDLNHVWNDEQIQAMDNLHLAWGKLKEDISWFLDREAQAVVNIALAIKDPLKGTFLDPDYMGFHELAEKAKPPIAAVAAGIKDLTMTASEEKTVERELHEQFMKNKGDEAEAVRKQATAEREADNIAMASYSARIDALRRYSSEYIKAYSFEGQIANLHQLEAAEYAVAKSVYESLNSERDRARVVNEFARQRVDNALAEAAIQEAKKDRVNSALVAEFQAQVKLNAAMGLDAAGAYAVQETALQKLNIALQELHRTKEAGISQAAQEQALIDEYNKSLEEEAKILSIIVGHGPTAPFENSTFPGGPPDKKASSFGGAGGTIPGSFASDADRAHAYAQAGIIISNVGLIPSLDVGGTVEETGFAKVHKGESIIPGGASPTVSVTLNISALSPGDAHVQEAVRQNVERVIMDVLKSRVQLGSA